MIDRETAKNPTCYRFGEFILEPERASLVKAGREIKLRPKVFDALRYLIEHRGRLVPKEELIQTLWPEAFVTDDSLVQCMVELRRGLEAVLLLNGKEYLMKQGGSRGPAWPPTSQV